MIATVDTDREQIGALSGITHQMGIAEDATAHIMDILSKGLYSRPREAVMREYSTNARDAQIEAGTDDQPILVKLPTDFNPVLRFRDYGTGLSEAEIGTIYSQYGKSTKQSSNAFNGMLGLGCKSAFSYTDQFTVVSWKNGIRIEVAVTRATDGSGGMIVVDQRASDEPSGTEVQIPCKRGDTFEKEARALYQWWEPGHVKVMRGSHEVEVAHFDKKAEGTLDLGDGIFIVKQANRYEREKNIVVMGGVGYPLTIQTDLDECAYHLVVFAPMGSVNFAPSREELVYNSTTNAYVAKVQKDFKDALIRTVQGKIDACTSMSEAVRALASWRDLIPARAIPATGYLYKGKVIPLNIQRDAAVDSFPMRKVPLERRGHHNGHRKVNDLNVEDMVDVLFIEGFSVENFNANHAQKARKYVADNGLKVPNGFVFLGTIPKDVRPWLENVTTYDAIKAVKLPRDKATMVSSGLSGRIPGSYDLLTTVTGQEQSQYGTPADTFKAWSGKLYYFAGNLREAKYHFNALKAASQTPITVVAMASSRIQKFKRNFPAAENVHNAVRSAFDAWKATVHADTLLAIAIQRDYRRDVYAGLDASKVDDPDLKRYIQLNKVDTKITRDQLSTFECLLGRNILALPKTQDWQTVYPLLTGRNSRHSIFYVNAVYAAKQNGVTI